MTTEEKARAYDEALEKAKEMVNNGYSSETTKEVCRELFSQLVESEDERIRKEIISALKFANDRGVYDKHIAYLERQKEQKPAEWSEEFLRLMGITISQDGNQVCVLLGENLAEGIAGFGDTLADAVEDFKKEWRQFDRFRKATWKPSELQMKALKNARYMMGQSGDYYDTTAIIDTLINDLQKLL